MKIKYNPFTSNGLLIEGVDILASQVYSSASIYSVVTGDLTRNNIESRQLPSNPDQTYFVLYMKPIHLLLCYSSPLPQL
jgi:hypothetical protein